MECFSEKIEKQYFKNLLTLTSILEIKSSEILSNNQKKINNFDLWLKDSNLLLIDEIKNNNQHVEMLFDLNTSRMHSPIVNRKNGTGLNENQSVYKQDNIDFFNVSDLIIADFVKNCIFFSNKLDNYLANNNSGNHNNLVDFLFISEDGKSRPNISNDKITENIKINNKNENEYSNTTQQNWEFRNFLKYNNSRKRQPEKIDYLLEYDLPSQQIKLEKESLNYKIRISKSDKLNNEKLDEKIQTVYDSTEKMDIENINSCSTFMIDNERFSFIKNDCDKNNLNRSKNSKIIPEQPSKEQDQSFTPQSTNRCFSFNEVCVKFNTKDYKKEDKNKLDFEFSNRISEKNINSKALNEINCVYDINFNLNPNSNKELIELEQNFSMNEMVPNNKNSNFVINNNLNNSEKIDENDFDINLREKSHLLHFNKIEKAADTDNSNPKISKKLYKSVCAENLNENKIKVVKLDKNQKLSFSSFINFENQNINCREKSEYTFKNLDDKNTKIFSNPNHDNNDKNIQFFNYHSKNKEKQKKISDGIKKLNLSKNYIEDNINDKDCKSTLDINPIHIENNKSDENYKNSIKVEDKMDIITIQKDSESTIVKSIYNCENSDNSNENKIKNEKIITDSNVKIIYSQIDNKNKSNKENENKGKSKNINNDKLNTLFKQESFLKNNSKKLLINNDNPNFHENFQTKKALNEIEININSNDTKKENIYNSLISKKYNSKNLEKIFEKTNHYNNYKLNILLKDDKSKKVSNFKVENFETFSDKVHIEEKEMILLTNQDLKSSEVKAENKGDWKEDKIKDAFKIDATKISQDLLNQSKNKKEKENQKFNDKENNCKNNTKTNNLSINPTYIDKLFTEINTIDIDINPNKINSNNNNIQLEVNEKILILNPEINNKEIKLVKVENSLETNKNNTKQESHYVQKDKCNTYDYEDSRVIEIGNNLVKKLCTYELTDETPNSSGYDETNDGIVDISNTPFFNHKKKKMNPEWALDKTYVREKILEQNSNRLHEKVFGERHRIEYLDLRNIFSTASSEFDIRGDSADWKMDNTISSRRYNRQSRIHRIDEELNDCNEENQIFSNFKKTSRNLYNDFQP